MILTSRGPFAAPGEQNRGIRRALAEVTGGGLLMVLTQQFVGSLYHSFPAGPQLGLGAVVLALLAVRRRCPVVSLLGVAAVLGLLYAAGLPAAVIAYTTVKQWAVHRHRTAVLLASALPTMLFSAVFAPLVGLGSHVVGLAAGGAVAAATLVVPGLVGISKGQQDRLLQALRERAAAAETAHRLADSESRTHERSRIAAEMHDLVGHRLSLVSLHTGGLEMALQKESPELRDEAALVRRAAGEAMRELREVLGILGPLGRDTGAGALTDATGTRPDVEALAEESRRGGIPVALTWDGPDLDERPAQVRRAVHRVVRESLTNVHRYAAGAQVTVTVAHTDDRVDVLVRNARPPAAPQAASGLGTGRGLVGLRERVALLGGALEGGPTPAGGFAVTARIPTRPRPGAAPSDVGAPPAEVPAEPGSGRPAVVLRTVVNALSAGLGLAGAGGLMLLGLVLVSSVLGPQPAPSEPEEQPRVGMSREKVEDTFFRDDTGVRAAATGREPARPKSATSCIYPTVTDDADFVPASGTSRTAKSAVRWPEEGAGRLRITRYCFHGDTLTAIDRFTVPVVSQATQETSHD